MLMLLSVLFKSRACRLISYQHKAMQTRFWQGLTHFWKMGEQKIFFCLRVVNMREVIFVVQPHGLIDVIGVFLNYFYLLNAGSVSMQKAKHPVRLQPGCLSGVTLVRRSALECQRGLQLLGCCGQCVLKQHPRVGRVCKLPLLIPLRQCHHTKQQISFCRKLVIR